MDIVVCLLGLGSPDSLDLLEYYRGEGLRVYAVLDAGHASLADMPLNQDNLVLASNPQVNKTNRKKKFGVLVFYCKKSVFAFCL